MKKIILILLIGLSFSGKLLGKPQNSNNPNKYTVYFAGALFTHKDLIGNKHLAQAIERKSNNKYSCILPQDLEFSSFDEVNIRNEEIKNVISADLIVAGYDGTDLDSGTVVEHTIAKFLDIPSVLIRTDYRNGGDQPKNPSNNWNLMCSFYPRTEVVNINSYQVYRQINSTPSYYNLNNLCKNYCDVIAEEIVLALDAVLEQKPLIGNTILPKRLYRWVINSCGSGLDKKFSEDYLDTLIKKKREKGLINL